MNFFVYEQDLLVRVDIIETLKDAFAGVTHLIEDISNIGVDGEGDATPSVFVLSVPKSVFFDMIASQLPLRNRGLLVLICDDLPAESQKWAEAQFLQRPFGADGLVKAVKTALSFRQSDPS